MFFLLLLFSLCVGAYCEGTLSVEVSARSAILMNADTGAILFAKNIHIPSYPASTTKIGTALFVLDEKKADLEQRMIVSEAALRMKSTTGFFLPYELEPDGTMMGLRKGEVLPLESLLYGMMMVSGNDAANVIAESLSGSISEFMKEMNSYLSRLGCEQTFYRNPHGLHDPQHVTSAYDLALMMKRGLSIRKFRDLISTSSYLRPKSNKSSSTEIVAFNQLIKPGRHYYPKSIGGKTGYHSQSMATFAAAAHHEGRTLIAVVLGCSKTSRYDDVKRLFEAAFQESLISRVMVSVDRVFLREMEGAEESLEASLQEPLNLSYFPSEEPKCRAFVHWHAAVLPIQQGQAVGEIQVVNDKGEIMTKASLLAKKSLQGTLSFRIKQWFAFCNPFIKHPPLRES